LTRDKKKVSSITLSDYIDIYQILENKESMSAENRSFALKHKELMNFPLTLLNLWRDSRVHLLPYPPYSKDISKLLSSITIFSFFIAFFAGVFSAIGLLHYNGKEPINLLYFFAIVFLFPLLTMGFTSSAMMFANRSHSIMVHISPAYWIEYIIAHLPSKHQDTISKIKLNPLISNWLIIYRSQSIALIFSVGLFITLLGSVASSDIAFSWSTTLHITAEELHSFFSIISIPWSEFIPSAVPSLELIEKSHYFRLGGKLDTNLVDNALLLGEWWKFLAMTTLTYSIILRSIFLIVSLYGFQRAINRSVLYMGRDILREMREPFITTQAKTEERHLVQNYNGDVDTIDGLQNRYPIAIGWALDSDTISEYNKKENISVDDIYEVGGRKSLEDDSDIVSKASGDILFYIKSWEPPTMDFIDFISELSHKDVTNIEIYLIGIKENEFKATSSDFEIWNRKLSLLEDDKIRIKI
jgi:hypothetical protein